MNRFAFTTLCLAAVASHAQSPWPGETWEKAVNLTPLAASDWSTNLSGAFWNPARRQLWVVNNSGYFHRLAEGGTLGFRIDTVGGKPARWAGGGDAEGITQADLNGDAVLVLNEDGYIEEYSTATPAVKKLHSWDIRSVAAPVDGSGPEGIAFVPDASLSAGKFTDKTGKPYVSKNGMGGLVFVAHQDGGAIHVFDCAKASNTVAHVGTYATSREESSDLAFDRSQGVLWVWHNTGDNSFEAMKLSSKPAGIGWALESIKEYAGPKAGNLEGMGIAPGCGGDPWYFATDDDNQDGHALMWFKSFKPGVQIPGACSATAITRRAESRPQGMLLPGAGTARLDGRRLKPSAH